MACYLVVVILWISLSGSLSRSWPSSMNSLFARNSKNSEIGLNKAVMESVGIGVQMALEHCQEKFKWDRWNCPESAFSRRSPLPLTRESAFALSLKTAGIIYAITQTCSRGELPHCGCGGPPPGDAAHAGTGGPPAAGGDSAYVGTGGPPAAPHWGWGGCSHSTEYAELVAEKLLGDGGDWVGVVGRHDYEVGKMVVRSSLQKHCRCHGVSGSCSLQTCWMQMAPFSEITNELRTKYEKAQKLNHDKKFNSVGDFNVIEDIPQGELVYLSDSPDYCIPDVITGWPGTLNRTCSRSKSPAPSERKSCKTLCRSCNLRVRRSRRRVTRRCNCSFTWCCEVTCDTCSDVVDEFFCE